MNGISVLNQYKGICNDIIGKFTTKLNKSFKSFLMETLVLYMVISGRINFLQLGRYGESCEQRFRQNFSKDFDWLEFNLSLADRVLNGDRKAIAMASYKTMMHNAYLLERFISVSGIKPNRRLNNKLVKEVVEFAAIVA